MGLFDFISNIFRPKRKPAVSIKIQPTQTITHKSGASVTATKLPSGQIKVTTSKGGKSSSRVVKNQEAANVIVRDNIPSSPKTKSDLTQSQIKTFQQQQAQEKFRQQQAFVGSVQTAPMKFQAVQTGYPVYTQSEISQGSDLSKEERVRQREESTGTLGLFKEGDLPGAIRQGARDVGTAYFRLIGKGQEKLGAGEISEGRIKQGGAIIGESALWAAFSPMISTGAVNKAAKGKTISKQISESKFDKLQQALGQIERELVQKKSAADQVKYLKELKTKYFAGEKGNEGFKALLTHLKEKQIIKDFNVATVSTPSETQTILQIEVETPPTMPHFSKVASSTTLDLKQKDSVKFVDIISSTPKLKTAPIITSMLSEKQISAGATKTKQRSKATVINALATSTLQVPRTSQTNRFKSFRMPRLTRQLAIPKIPKIPPLNFKLEGEPTSRSSKKKKKLREGRTLAQSFTMRTLNIPLNFKGLN